MYMANAFDPSHEIKPDNRPVLQENNQPTDNQWGLPEGFLPADFAGFTHDDQIQWARSWLQSNLLGEPDIALARKVMDMTRSIHREIVNELLQERSQIDRTRSALTGLTHEVQLIMQARALFAGLQISQLDLTEQEMLSTLDVVSDTHVNHESLQAETMRLQQLWMEPNLSEDSDT